MADLITCPNCGLSQSAMHAFCARCDSSFATTGPARAISDDLIGPGAGIETGEYAPTAISDRVPTVQESAPSLTPTPGDRSGNSLTGTPTDRDSGGVSPPTGSNPAVDPEDNPATASTTMEAEDRPAGPSWNMPGRDEPRAEAFPAPALRNARREKRSLSGRSRPAGGTPPATPALERAPEPVGSHPGRPKAQSHPGSVPGSDLRGRPPGKLFASENSIPPGDPLMAALVSGEALRADSFPEIEFNNAPTQLREEPPPVQQDVDSAEDHAAVSTPEGRRVVPPSRGRRGRSSAGYRSRPGGLLPDGPGRIAPPNAATEVRPAIPRERSAPGTLRPPQESRPGSVSGVRSNAGSSIPAMARPEPRRSAPGIHIPDPRRSSLADGRAPDDVPLPPPPDLGDDLGKGMDPVLVRRGVKVAAAVAAIGVIALAVLDVSSMIADVGALKATLNSNIRSDGLPTPDLPRMLDHAVDELELGDNLVSAWSRISAEDDRFEVGVEVEHSVVGLPQRTRVSREGAFVVADQLKTLEFYLAEWDLDDQGQRLLDQDKQRRNRQ